jgi:neutral ceramidase
MGYASLEQTDTGLHMRQRSRAFIIGDASKQSSRVVFINADIAMGDTGVRRTIVSELSSKYPGLYTNENIAFVGTHQVSRMPLQEINTLYIQSTQSTLASEDILKTYYRR